MTMVPTDRVLALDAIHDLNNDLGVILNYATVLARDLADRPKAAQYTTELVSAGQHAVQLVAQLSELIEPAPGPVAPGDPS